MHAQTISTTTNTEVTPARALAAMLLATSRTKDERRKLDDLFPQAKQAESRLAWKDIAKGVRNLHRQISFGDGKVGDVQSVVGDAYRKASRASHRDSGASAQLAAHVAIETIAKSFVTDGTYANYAVNPDGIQNIAALVGELQHQSRSLNRALGLGGLAINEVFFSDQGKPPAAVDATPKGEVARLYPEWKATKAASANEGSGAGRAPISDRFAELERQIQATPCRTVDDATTKLKVLLDVYEDGGMEMDPDHVVEQLKGAIAGLDEDARRREWMAAGAIMGREAVTAHWMKAKARFAWDAAVKTVDEAEAAYQEAKSALDEYELAHPEEGDSDSGYAAVNAVVDEAQARQYGALQAVVEVMAPDAAALARQVQTYAWLNCVTQHRIKGLTGWPMDPAEPLVAAAVEVDGDSDERGLLALYRSAHALAGSPPILPVSPDHPQAPPEPALLAAE
jgi:hypothetical protein